jgi:hypothetical protein
MRLVGGVHRPCEHEGPEADGRGGRTGDWRPVGASPRPPSKPTRLRHGFTSKRRPSSTRQRHTAAWPPPISEGPRCRGERRTPGRRRSTSARRNCGWRNRLVPTASRCASRAYVEDHLRPVTGGTYGSRCRRLGSPQSSREVPAETQRSPPEPAGGRATAEGSVFGGVRRPRGWSPGTGGSGLAAGGAAQGRGCPPPATRRHLCPGPLRHGRSGPGLSRTRHAHRSALPERTSSRRASCIRQGQARCARPFGTSTVGRRCARGSSRARASCWLASRAVLRRYVVMFSGVVRPARMSQV